MSHPVCFKKRLEHISRFYPLYTQLHTLSFIIRYLCPTWPHLYREDTLRSYFSQFGSLEHVEVMKDRYTGKSRGFGFISFMEHPAALRALNAEHLIDGRRCEAKVALPKVGVDKNVDMSSACRRRGPSQIPTTLVLSSGRAFHPSNDEDLRCTDPPFCHGTPVPGIL